MQTIEKQLQALKKGICNCCKVLPTTVGVPTEAPTKGQTVKIDLSTGIIYYYDSDTSTWEIASGDTHFFNTNLTQTSARLHDAAGFDTEINNQGDFIVRSAAVAKEIRLRREVTGINVKVDLIDSGVEIGSDDGVNISGLVIGDTIVLSNNNGDYYIGDGFFSPGPPLDNTKNVAISTDTSTGKLYTNDLSNSKKDQIDILIDGSGAAITTGYKGRFRVPYSGTITGWTMFEVSETPLTGSIVVDVQKGTYTNYDTTPTFISMSGADSPWITANVKNRELDIVGSGYWNDRSVVAGDIIQYVVDSASTIKKVQLLIDITKS